MKNLFSLFSMFFIVFVQWGDCAPVFAATRAASDSGRTAAVQRSATNQTNVRSLNSRAVSTAPSRVSVNQNSSGGNSAVAARSGNLQSVIKSKSAVRSTIARAASDDTLISGTRTGAEYEKCKNSYFACMDQFCSVKDTNYQRCSCSDRVYDLKDTQSVMQEAADQLTEFNENLDTVSMTDTQATAMRTASEGENALTKDSSASKALLQAIMNSIRGDDTSVGGDLSSLNSISIPMDSSSSFGSGDMGQTVASYNGGNLYTAVYNQCRSAVRNDCNDAALQRAVTAYLMAIEQDCNKVGQMLDENKSKLSSSVRESGAMLGLARVENRQTHNSSDMTTCLNEVEQAILSDQVCGANYAKCLDSGKYIDIQTGKPITGVVDFYKLGEQLTFSDSSSIADQKLSKVPNNRSFVQNFESRTKKFATDALDKCSETSDEVWADYLDKALLEIYYAQQSKVEEIREGCMDFVSACYTNGEKSLTDSMAGIVDSTLLKPDFIAVTESVCKEYVESCNNMFSNDSAGDIIDQYISNRSLTDTVTACRAVAQKCFDEYGGTGYANYYNPSSGIFTSGLALDWFTLYDRSIYDPDDPAEASADPTYVSLCAQQLANVTSCSGRAVMEKVFGGFDKKSRDDSNNVLDMPKYGLVSGTNFDATSRRYTGVATEVYNKITDSLYIQCQNLYGRFVEKAFLATNMYDSTNPCITSFSGQGLYNPIASDYAIEDGEDMCPVDYSDSIDTKSWGACLCWENGGRRSENGTTVQCVSKTYNSSSWNSANINVNGKVCPAGMTTDGTCCVDSTSGSSACATGVFENIDLVPDYVY